MLSRRKALRLKCYDYAAVGAYFVTVCVHQRECLFGGIIDGKIHLNQYGEIVKRQWLQTGEIRSNIKLDEFMIMSNHFHAVFYIIPVGAYGHTPLQSRTFHSPSKSVGAVVRGFKSVVTVQINKLRKTPFMPVWQRNYYDHVIRNDADLNRVRQYIETNPSQWADDAENPAKG